MKEKHIKNIYVDRVYLRNSRKSGGYGFVLEYDCGGTQSWLKGFVDTTGNRMALTGVIDALNRLSKPCEATIYTTSQYVVSGMELEWARTHRANGWRQSGNQIVKNSDLWEQLLDLAEKHSLKFIWTPKRNGHEYSQKCRAFAMMSAEMHRDRTNNSK